MTTILSHKQFHKAAMELHYLKDKDHVEHIHCQRHIFCTLSSNTKLNITKKNKLLKQTLHCDIKQGDKPIKATGSFTEFAVHVRSSFPL